MWGRKSNRSPESAFEAPAATDRQTLARAVADAARSVPGVARLVGGDHGAEAATHYPGGRVVGVALTPEVVSVHFAAGSLPLPPIVDAVFAAVGQVLAGFADRRSLQVVVEDLDDAALASPIPAVAVRSMIGGR